MSNSQAISSDSDRNGPGKLFAQMSIRWRLTIWYASSLCLLLIGFSVIFWSMTNAWLTSQSDAELDEELVELLDSIHISNDDMSLTTNVGDWSRLHEPYGFEFEIRSADGTILMRSERLTHAEVSLNTIQPAPDTITNYLAPGVGLLRVKDVDVEVLGQPKQLWIAMSQVEQQTLLRQLSGVLFTAGLVVMFGAIAGGYLLSRRVLHPIDQITKTAERITANGLDSRITIENPHDELGRLVQTLNMMLDRLDLSFAELKRFTADAAHELRTPLTLLRSQLEVTLRQARSDEEYERALRSALDDTQRVCSLAEQLLELTRGDDDNRLATNDSVPVAALIADVVAQLKPLAEAKGVVIEVDPSLAWTSREYEGKGTDPTSAVAVSGDCVRLRRLFLNVLENAVKYTPAGGQVRLHADTSQDAVTIHVVDSGCGITEEHLPRVFDRFYRVDRSRTTTTGGTGLGLAICRSIAEAHSGTIEISSTPTEGTDVAVFLPAFDQNS